MAKLIAKAPVLTKQLIEASKPKLNTFWKYAKVELTPPTPADIPKISQGLGDLLRAARTGRWRHLTVKEAWLNTLVASEIVFLFFIGECIGKWNLVGFNIAPRIKHD